MVSFSSKILWIIKRGMCSNTDVIIFTGIPDQRMKHLAAELADITKSKTESGIQIMGLSSWNNSTSILSEPAFQHSWFTMPDYRFRKFYENKFIKKFGYKLRHFETQPLRKQKKQYINGRPVGRPVDPPVDPVGRPSQC